MKTADFLRPLGARSNGRAILAWLGIGIVAQLLVACASTTAPASISVAQALATPDHSKVVITAQLVQQLDGERYLFHDSSGQVTVVIDDEILGQVKLAPEARLRIYGSMNQDHKPPLLEAKTIQVVQ